MTLFPMLLLLLLLLLLLFLSIGDASKEAPRTSDHRHIESHAARTARLGMQDETWMRMTVTSSLYQY